MKIITGKEFDAEVLKASSPVLVDFFTDYCMPCKQLAPILEEIAAENAATLKIVKVNAGDEQVLASSYRIASVPTLILFRSGKVVAQTAGLRPKKDLQKWITESLSAAH